MYAADNDKLCASIPGVLKWCIGRAVERKLANWYEQEKCSWLMQWKLCLCSCRSWQQDPEAGGWGLIMTTITHARHFEASWAFWSALLKEIGCWPGKGMHPDVCQFTYFMFNWLWLPSRAVFWVNDEQISVAVKRKGHACLVPLLVIHLWQLAPGREVVLASKSLWHLRVPGLECHIPGLCRNTSVAFFWSQS